MKGIILAGGSGSRLYPVTKAVSKQLLPINDKPMIYYPLSILMLAGIREILIICNEQDLSSFKRLFGDGSNLGLEIEYEIQHRPEGIAQAFLLAEEFINDKPIALILGDNIFYGDGLPALLKTSIQKVVTSNEALIFGYEVSNPSDYGVVSFDPDGRVMSIEEKPANPKSNCAAVGLYFYPGDVSKISKKVNKSDRGEYEISTLNEIYLNQHRLNIEILGRGMAWLDTGTFETLMNANTFVSTIESRQGLKIACIEEISFINGWIDKTDLKNLADSMGKSKYSEYLQGLIGD